MANDVALLRPAQLPQEIYYGLAGRQGGAGDHTFHLVVQQGHSLGAYFLWDAAAPGFSPLAQVSIPQVDKRGAGSHNPVGRAEWHLHNDELGGR